MTDLDNIKKEVDEEYYAYLKVMEGWRNYDNKCEHRKAKLITAFQYVGDNLEAAELSCIECGEFLGIVYRKVKNFRVEKITTKVIQKLNLKHLYYFKEK